MEEKLTTETLVELVENVLKNNIFQFNKKTLKQLEGTAIGTKFAPPYAILFMANLEERILEDIEPQARMWLLKQLMPFIPLSNSLRKGQEKN